MMLKAWYNDRIFPSLLTLQSACELIFIVFPFFEIFYNHAMLSKNIYCKYKLLAFFFISCNIKLARVRFFCHMRTEVSVFKRDKSYRDQLINFIPWSLNLSLELLYIFYEYWDEWLGSIKTELIFFYESKMIFKQLLAAKKSRIFKWACIKIYFSTYLACKIIMWQGPWRRIETDCISK